MNSLHNQRGVALMGVLMAVVVLGLMSGIAGSSWKSIVQRAKEEELLWRGSQYRKAIESYYKSSQGGAVAALPTDLEKLVKDDRSIAVLRHLRKLYNDPMTGNDWVVIKDPSGKISGVRSSSELEVFKQDGFDSANSAFVGKTRYSEWEFVFQPTTAQKVAKPASKTQ
ncbi:Type II secretory pathway, pseudopilin PulG [Malonomonas rubra DSM 5091]|uniref:Type II secretory pathway, pseudopilin PulG n=1 Tax=Malonomonas rubra DSM 5091 TaxID=1122189 RepID=A0A1M6I1F6_MALRU|nr:type II secretion system protein [Malonomonas rubra]SHJ28084.1 Type II secretory pathway, pseudopilin PulG [Malonomonas rubra DSM 5091]